jgi:hypothetical protein
MKYGDYLHHDPAPAEFEEVTEKLEASDLECEKSDFQEHTPDNQNTLPQVLALPISARRNADPLPGQHPLVLSSGGKASRAGTAKPRRFP